VLLPYHHESSAIVTATPVQLFEYVDDHARLASHMSESSWMMGGGRMRVDLDEAKGRALGSHIKLSGWVFGIRVFLDEVVTRRDPPFDKAWETVGAPRLLVIGAYRMGFQITPERNGSRLRVFIDYDLPTGWATYWLGVLFGGVYANWCVAQMLSDALRHFASGVSAAA